MSKTTELETVRFHQDTLYGTRINRSHHENGWDAYAAIKPICDNLGIGWHGQFERIKRDAVLSSTIRVIRTVAADGKQREMVMLPIDFIPGWLFGIDANRVKPELRDKIIQYQRECYRVLARHFGFQERFARQQAEGALRQAERYWFGRYPHWRHVRDYYVWGFTFKLIAEHVQKSVSACRRAVKSMEKVGLINPRQAALHRLSGKQYDLWLDLNPRTGW